MAATTAGISGDISASLSDNKSDSPSSQPLESEEEGLEAEEEAPSNVEQSNAADFESAASEELKKWPGWPGESVFRLVVPLMKVGSIIGRKGEHIKKICEETRARVRVLEGIIGTNERIVSDILCRQCPFFQVLGFSLISLFMLLDYFIEPHLRLYFFFPVVSFSFSCFSGVNV